MDLSFALQAPWFWVRTGSESGSEDAHVRKRSSRSQPMQPCDLRASRRHAMKCISCAPTCMRHFCQARPLGSQWEQLPNQWKHWRQELGRVCLTASTDASLFHENLKQCQEMLSDSLLFLACIKIHVFLLPISLVRLAL